MLTKDDLLAIGQVLDEKLKPITEELQKVDERLSNIEEDIRDINDAIGIISEWAEKVADKERIPFASGN